VRNEKIISKDFFAGEGRVYWTGLQNALTSLRGPIAGFFKKRMESKAVIS